MNDNAENKADKDSFSVISREQKEEKESEKAGRGTETEQERTLADDKQKSERLELVEGQVTSDEGQRKADLFQHVMDKRDEDRAALDREDKDVREQVFQNDFEMEVEEEVEETEKVRQLEEMNKDKNKKDGMMDTGPEKGGEKEKSEKVETKEKEFVPTVDVARGADTLIMRQAECSPDT